MVEYSAHYQAHERARARAVHPSSAYVAFTTEQLNRSAVELFEGQAARAPAALAVAEDGGSWCYGELDTGAEGVAGRILATCGGRDARVAIMIDSCAAMVAAVLAALKAGVTFVPIDPSSTPAERAGYLLRDSGSTLVLTTTRHLPFAREVADGLDVVDVGAIDADPKHSFRPRKPSPDDIAWIIYTSGSTGQPKGVAQPYRNLVHFLATEAEAYRICAEDRCAVVFSSSVNFWYRETLSALIQGASVHLVDMRTKGFSGLAATLIDQRITLMTMVPSLFRKFAPTVRLPLPSLRVIKVGGEPVLRTDFDAFKRTLPRGCVFINRFGSTETAPVRYHFLDHDSEVTDTHLPIGYPVPGSELLILEPDGTELPPDEMGEIVVRSPFLAACYWNKPEITEATFRPDPDHPGERLYWTGDMGLKRPDGGVVHLGRRDNQVQIRGYRVEIAEIEIRLRELDGVVDAAAAAVEGDGAETALVGYIVPGEVRPSVTTLRDALRAKLPAYMVPTRWVFLQALPRAPNGKLHRKALPPPAAPEATDVDAYGAPSTAMERLIAGYWKKVLRDVKHIGLQDRFVDLGGDSLGAMRVIILIESDTGVQVSLIAFWSQTLGQLAAYCDAERAASACADSASGSRTIPSVRREPGRTAPRREGQDGRPG